MVEAFPAEANLAYNKFSEEDKAVLNDLEAFEEKESHKSTAE